MIQYGKFKYHSKCPGHGSWCGICCEPISKRDGRSKARQTNRIKLLKLLKHFNFE